MLAASAAERRQLTVMFCDMVGSTALSERLDPEELRDIVRAFQESCAGVIAEYDGYVARYMGDGMLVYFGYPQAHEDDAERGVRTGLGIVQAVGQLPVKDGFRPEVRVGIATGMVVAGDLIGEGAVTERAALGDTPNLAARLQSLAEPGTVAIAPGTHRLVQPLFEFHDLGEHRLKGISAPVRVFRVLSERIAETRFDAVVASGVTPLVGREVELDMLMGLWRRTLRGEGQVALVSGEPGIGKSRVLLALRERLAETAHTRVHLQCSAYHASSAFHPVLEQLRHAARIEAEDPPPVQLDKLEHLLELSGRPVREAAPLFAALLSIPPGDRYPPLELAPQRRKERMLDAMIEQLAGLAELEPVLFLMEDAHWIDPSSLELLDRIVSRIPDLRMLAIVTFRPEFEPPWRGEPHVTSLALNRLSRRECAAIVRAIAHGRVLPEEVLEQILARTDGIALFVEELTKTVLESGLMRAAGDRLLLSSLPMPLAIPATLRDSLMARLDRLAPVKEVAQIGASIGREFSYELISAVSRLPEDALADALSRLVEAGLVSQRGQPPRQSYSFKTALVRDIAYESLLKSTRQQLHARIAEALEEGFPAIVESAPELLAHHLGAAALPARALGHWLAAGRRANLRSEYAEAVAHLRRGLSAMKHLPDTAETRRLELSLLTTLGPAMRSAHGNAAPGLLQVYNGARELSRELGDGRELFGALNGLCAAYVGRGDYESAREYAEQCLTLARDVGDVGLRVEAERLVGSIAALRGDLPAAEIHLAAAMEAYRAEQHAKLAFAYGYDPGPASACVLAFVRWSSGYPSRARVEMEEAVGSAERSAHAHTLALVLAWQSLLAFCMRDIEAMGGAAERLIELSLSQGFRGWAAMGRVLQECARGPRDEPADRASVEHGLRDYQATHGQMLVPILLAIAGEGDRRAGDPHSTGSRLEAALELAGKTGEHAWTAEIHRQRAELALASDPDDGARQAEEALRRALEIARAQGARSPELRAETSIARLRVRQGRREEALPGLERLYRSFTEGFDTEDLTAAKTLLEGPPSTVASRQAS
jgi:class 3 adenylate cyclase/tetratricopeptide (TPR) repeat protein